MGASKGASVSVHTFRLAMKKGLASEGKTFECDLEVLG
jgi:hypothetical protein